MKLRLIILALICLILAAIPAKAGTVYDDGPINGTVNAWNISFGYAIGDTFTVSAGTSTLTGLTFGAWLTPGDTLETVEVTMTSQAFGGTVYFDQTVSFSASGCTVNGFGYDVCTETGMFHGPTLANGTYWLEMQNAVVNNGDPVYWDENSGIGCTSPGCPSEATCPDCILKKDGGDLPPESFTLYGNVQGTTPEPGSFLLFGSGVLTVVGLVRRRFR